MHQIQRLTNGMDFAPVKQTYGDDVVDIIQLLHVLLCLFLLSALISFVHNIDHKHYHENELFSLSISFCFSIKYQTNTFMKVIRKQHAIYQLT
jgi:hypothetical protein